jgi:hypothetical protein
MNLLREYRQFDRRCTRIEGIARHAVAYRFDDPLLFETYLSHAIVALHDAWAFRCRAIVLRSAAGGTCTVSGRMLPRTHARPLECLRGRWARRRMQRTWEPDWFVPANAIRAATILGVTNINQIVNGLGASTAAEEVRITRNVVAHSLPTTWRRLRQLQLNFGHTGRETPAGFAVLRYPAVGLRHIERWIAELRACIHVAVG